jgi:FAD/FMN-containing dehydrogenase
MLQRSNAPTDLSFGSSADVKMVHFGPQPCFAFCCCYRCIDWCVLWFQASVWPPLCLPFYCTLLSALRVPFSFSSGMICYSNLVIALLLLVAAVHHNASQQCERPSDRACLIVLMEEYNLTGAMILADTSDKRDLKRYANSVRMANFACRDQCPGIVAYPSDAHQVATVVRFASAIGFGLSVKNGGHSYTCQASQEGGDRILVDMTAFKSLRLLPPRNGQPPSGIFGAGLTWGEALKQLQRYNLTAVHGQCTSVGVTGFSIHGGVHFGGLSELYGLGSDNIRGIEIVTANASVVRVNSTECIIDGVRMSDEVSTNWCRELLFAVRGAGSSFGIVTALEITTHPYGALKSALSIVSLDLADVKAATALLSKYMDGFPKDVSLTFFGLDAYFKAYAFLLRFVDNRTNSLVQGFSRELVNVGKKRIHFVMEASWSSSYGRGYDEVQSLHSHLSRNADYNKIGTFGSWYSTTKMWSVTNYELVWGKGHSYSGATAAVTRDGTENLLESAISAYHKYIDEKLCSDCVMVLHRMGKGLQSFSFQSAFNPERHNATLWLEVDCGLFYRHRHRWSSCASFVDATQTSFDESTSSARGRFHYTNVPNLQTAHWESQYYGESLYSRLQRTKALWDPSNTFSHRQSIQLSSGDSISHHEQLGVSSTIFNETVVRTQCNQIYDAYASKDEQALVAVGLGGSSVLGGAWLHRLVTAQRRREVQPFVA